MLTREQAYEIMSYHEYIMFNYNYGTVAGRDIIDKIYDEHEAQLKQAYMDGSNSTNELIQSLYKQIEQLKDK